MFLVGVGYFAPLMAQEVLTQHVLKLKNNTIHLAADAAKWIDSISKQPTAKNPLPVMLHFTTLPTAAQRKIMEQNGILLQDYIPDNTYSALLQPRIDKATITSLPIYSIINIKPEWKADDRLWQSLNTKTGATDILVSFFKNIDDKSIKQFVTEMGGQLHTGPMERYSYYKITIASAKVQALAQWYGVRYISPSAPMVPLDLQSRPAVTGNVSGSAIAYGGYNLQGDGMTIGVGDESSGIYHADLKDRITNFNPAPNAHHGEFVNGIAGGAANIDPLAVSITPHVSLVDFLFDLILPSTGAMYRDYNMTITNNSYEVIAGDCSYAGTYDAYAEFLDTLSIQYPYVQHVFASGNDGSSNCSPYLPGFATVGGGYQPAKNAVVVGSMTDNFVEADDESRGPVKDGRLKPDMVAVGLGAYSTINMDQYEWSAGTSMACPQVASGLAALTQRYKNIYGTQPRADLLKTILLNGAKDIGNLGPDYSYGFGAMDLYRSLQIIDSSHFTAGTISNSDSQTINITVPANSGTLKIMLCWNDVPASPSAAAALVNDLDLSVQTPSLTTHLPLVLNPAPAHVNDNATEQADHLNNVEQVIINNPLAGTYAIKVKGYNIPSGPQPYVIAYDIIPNTVKLTFPIGGEQLDNIDSIRIFWEAVTDTNTFTAQFSTDDGSTWTTLYNNIPPTSRYCSFMPTGINSGNCLVRVLKNNTTLASSGQRFVICNRPLAVADTIQCPGYVNIHWSPVPNASAYYLLKKVGFYMQVVDSTTDTSYSFSGMPLHENSYVTMQPLINGLPGYRSVAVIRQADDGNCTNPRSTGDLMADSILAPHNGRRYTSTQPGSNIDVQLRDLYTTACSHYTLSWQVNGGVWQQLTDPGAIPANSTVVITIPGIDFSVPGSYLIRAAVTNNTTSDPQPLNDTISATVLTIANDAIDLSTPLTDGFESMPVFSLNHDSIGVSPNGYWDYYNQNDSGRMRSYVDDDVTITGNRSVSLDENQATNAGSMNSFTGTFNLQNYDTATSEIRIDFDYVLHGTPKTAAGNIVEARSADTTAWTPFYAYDLNAYPGTVNHVLSLSLTDAVRLSDHNFSPGTQISFGQNDTSLIATSNYGNGITLDNFKMYTVANDAALVSVVTPLPTNCGLPASVPLTVQVHNGVNYTLHNVQLYYTIDSGAVFSGTIDSIAAKATINFTFTNELSVSPGSTHSLNIWLSETGDTYHANDSILNYQFRNSIIISAYPYLENFEGGTGGYYTEGINDSWQYGTPASPRINKAASGIKAWKTNLTGTYNNLEHSYLYAPCFDLSSLSNPMLSFSTAMDIENCGTTLCDAGYIEYSFDGLTWTRLGSYGQGTNWYDSTFNIWNTEGFTRWHVASIPLPQPPAGGSLRFRFVLSSDPGATFEGIAVDDIHIFDLAAHIYPSGVTVTDTRDLSGNQWTDYTLSNQLLASVQPNGQTINNTSVTLYAQSVLTNPGATQYTFPRSYTIKTAASPTDTAGIRLYLTDSDVVNVLSDTTCPSCSRFPDAYSLGITQYDNAANRAAENSTLSDDTGGVYTYYPYRAVMWVPYDKGYYAQLHVRPFSEFWFNDGGPTGTFPAGIDYLNFLAFRNGSNVTAYWYSLIDTAVNSYTLERSADSISYTDILDTSAVHTATAQYAVNDPQSFASANLLYYRLRWTMTGKDSVYYSPVRKVTAYDTAANLVILTAQMSGPEQVQVGWTSYIDGMVSYYILERAIGTESYITLETVSALHHYAQQYGYTDNLGKELPQGTPVHYRLTAVLTNGNHLVLPIRTVEWANPNSIVNIFPNPTHDNSFSIQWFANAGTNMQIVLTDASGRRVYESAATATQWNNTSSFLTPQLAHGVYFLRIMINGQKYADKIVYE